MEKFGVTPDRVIDVLALIGDKSDNVPGVPGIGEKTAIPLIQKYSSLENLYSHIDEIPQKGVREKLSTHRELAFLSKRLVTIETAVPVGIDFHSLRAKPADVRQLLELFTDLEFKSLAARLRSGKDQAGSLTWTAGMRATGRRGPSGTDREPGTPRTGGRGKPGDRGPHETERPQPGTRMSARRTTGGRP